MAQCVVGDYALRHPSSYYAAQFRPEAIQVVPHRPAEYYLPVPGRGFVPADRSAEPQAIFLGEEPEYGRIAIDRGGADEFEVRFPSTGGSVADEHVGLARRVLDRIAEMDLEVRWAGEEHRWDDFDYEEYLEGVEISSDKVELHYVAGACNSDWVVAFDVRPDGSFGPRR